MISDALDVVLDTLVPVSRKERQGRKGASHVMAPLPDTCWYPRLFWALI